MRLSLENKVPFKLLLAGLMLKLKAEDKSDFSRLVFSNMAFLFILCAILYLVRAERSLEDQMHEELISKAEDLYSDF